MTNETALEPTQSEEAVTQSTSIFDELDAESSAEEVPEETAEIEAGAEEATEEEDDSNWLPSEQLKEFTPEVIAKYAKRYGYTDEEIKADPRLARFLKDKINSDIEIANRKKAEEEAANEAEQEEVEQAEEPTPLPPAEAWAQMEKTLNTIVDEITNPEVAMAWVDRLAKADGIADKKERAVQIAKVFTFGMSNAMRDLLPRYLNDGNWLQNQFRSFLDQNLPGISDSHYESSLASAVESVRSSNPQFATMPKFGTPEWNAAAQKADQIMPDLKTVKFFDKQGRELPRLERFKRMTDIMFKLATNQPGAVAQAEKAIQTGERIAAEKTQRKKNATLGAGQSKGLAPKATSNDDLFGAPGEIVVSQKLIGKQS